MRKPKTPIPKSKYEFCPSKVKTIHYKKEQVDETTGEVRKVNASFSIGTDPFIKIYNPVFLAHLSKIGVAMFCCVIKDLGYGNIVFIDVSRMSLTPLAVSLGLNPSKMYRAIKELIDVNFMYRDGLQRYRVNPNFVQRGNFKPSDNNSPKTFYSVNLC